MEGAAHLPAEGVGPWYRASRVGCLPCLDIFVNVVRTDWSGLNRRHESLQQLL